MMAELKERLKAQTPTWFKKIRLFGLWLSAVAGAIAGFNLTYPGIMPEQLLNIVGYAAAIGLAMSATAHTAKEDKA